MAMIYYPVQAALRKDCIWAVFPLRGGSILNPLKQATTLYPVAGSAESGSWAVKNGLLGLRNSKINHNGFRSIWDVDECDEVNSSTGGWIENMVWVDTPLDLRGNTTSKTFIAKIYCPKPDPWAGQQQCQILLQSAIISNGNIWYTSKKDTVIRFLVEISFDKSTTSVYDVDARTCSCLAGIVFDDPDSEERIATTLSCPMPTGWYDRQVIYALVVDYDSNPGFIEMRIYIDGALQATSELLPARAWSTSEEVNTTMRMRNEVTATSATYNTAAWGLIFDSVLSEEEIKKFK